jgi:hypothetical protein
MRGPNTYRALTYARVVPSSSPFLTFFLLSRTKILVEQSFRDVVGFEAIDGDIRIGGVMQERNE